MGRDSRTLDGLAANRRGYPTKKGEGTGFGWARPGGEVGWAEKKMRNVQGFCGLRL